MSDVDGLIARGLRLATRLGLDPNDLVAIKAGPVHGYLVLLPLIERVVDRLDALEQDLTAHTPENRS